MGAAAKYLFDVDFSGGADAKPTIAVAEAQTQAMAESSRLTAMALETVAGVFDRLDQALHGVEAKLEVEAIEVAVAVGRKLAAALVAREPFAEIAALASECFRQLVAAPHVVVRVNAALYAPTRDRLDEILRASGFEGRLVVLAEPDLAPGDCRIEWADGGVNRDSAAAETAIADTVQRYITARCNAAAPNDNAERSAP